MPHFQANPKIAAEVQPHASIFTHHPEGAVTTAEYEVYLRMTYATPPTAHWTPLLAEVVEGKVTLINFHRLVSRCSIAEGFISALTAHLQVEIENSFSPTVPDWQNSEYYAVVLDLPDYLFDNSAVTPEDMLEVLGVPFAVTPLQLELMTAQLFEMKKRHKEMKAEHKAPWPTCKGK
jgi:hypothetical protein